MNLAQRIRLFFLLGREFFSPRAEGGVLSPEGLFLPSPPSGPERLYLAVSHALLQFEVVHFPAPVPEKKRLQAARLEAQRLWRLLGEEGEVSFSFWPKGPREVLVAAVKAGELSALGELPGEAVLCGLFPAWVALWAYLLGRTRLTDALYYLRTPWGYEGLVIRDGRPEGVMPVSESAGRLFLRHFSGEKFQVTGRPLEVLAEGARLAPRLLPREEVPCFEGFPLRVRPEISLKALSLWLLPLVLFTANLKLEGKRKALSLKAQEVSRELKELKGRYGEIEARRKALEEEKKLAEAIKPYLPEERPPLLEALLVLTRAFPQEAWVRRLEFRGPDTIRLWGECENALKLLEALSSSPAFKEARFLSTVTKNPRTGKEVFSMMLKLNPAYQPDLLPEGLPLTPAPGENEASQGAEEPKGPTRPKDPSGG